MAEIPQAKSVRTHSAAAEAQVANASLVRTLMGGTPAMRSAGETYLPKEEGETHKAYMARMARSVLFGALGKTVADMTGKVFAKPIVLKEDVPPKLQEYAENVDLAGRHINVFARDVFFDAMQTGVSYLLGDMPPKAGDVTRTVAEEQAAGIRPYLVHLPIERVLGWKSQTIGGVETLTQFRILESVSEPDGEFHEKDIEQVRVLEPGRWTIYRKDAKGEQWVPYENGVTTLNYIPIVAVYANRTGFLTGSPPLAALAEKNVEHWQSGSDQRNILHVARVPILFGAGFGQEDVLMVGAGSMIRNSDPNAKLTYVEHTGAAITSGRDDLKDIEFQMQVMGLQLLVPDPGQSATGEIRDDAKENSPLAMMARALGDAIEGALAIMGEFAGLGKDKGGSVTVNTDFGIQAAAATDVPQIAALRTARVISLETAWAELQRRGFLSDDFDPETESALIDAEAPELDGGPGSPPLE